MRRLSDDHLDRMVAERAREKRSPLLPGQEPADRRRLLEDAWDEGLRTGMIRPVGEGES